MPLRGPSQKGIAQKTAKILLYETLEIQFRKTIFQNARMVTYMQGVVRQNSPQRKQLFSI